MSTLWQAPTAFLALQQTTSCALYDQLLSVQCRRISNRYVEPVVVPYTPFQTTQASCTSCDVRQDKSAYWTPQLYIVPATLNDTRQDAIVAAGGIRVPVRQGGLVVYYKFITNRGERLNNDPAAWERIVPFPPNFRMLVPEGMVLNVTRRARIADDRPVSYLCLGGPNQGTTLINFPDDPRVCTTGLRAQFTLPSCTFGVWVCVCGCVCVGVCVWVYCLGVVWSVGVLALGR